MIINNSSYRKHPAFCSRPTAFERVSLAIFEEGMTNAAAQTILHKGISSYGIVKLGVDILVTAVANIKAKGNVAETLRILQDNHPANVFQPVLYAIDKGEKILGALLFR